MARDSAKENFFIVAVCGSEVADQIQRQLADLKTGCLIAYRRAEDMMLNSPAGRVALAIMAGEDDPADMQWTLHWLRHRWPGCPITVVSNAGGLENEMVARQGGAFYLTSDEAGLLLPHMISHALRVKAGSAFPLSPVTH